MASTIKQRLRRYNGTDYDTIHLETETACITDFPHGSDPAWITMIDESDISISGTTIYLELSNGLDLTNLSLIDLAMRMSGIEFRIYHVANLTWTDGTTNYSAGIGISATQSRAGNYAPMFYYANYSGTKGTTRAKVRYYGAQATNGVFVSDGTGNTDRYVTIYTTDGNSSYNSNTVKIYPANYVYAYIYPQNNTVTGTFYRLIIQYRFLW